MSRKIVRKSLLQEINEHHKRGAWIREQIKIRFPKCKMHLYNKNNLGIKHKVTIVHHDVAPIDGVMVCITGEPHKTFVALIHELEQLP